MQGTGFFLTDEQLNALEKGTVDLESAAADLIKSRSDFTIGELLNYAFLNAYKGRVSWQSHRIF